MGLVAGVLGFAAIATAAPVQAGTNLLVNGDFENTGFGGTTGYYNVGPSGSGADHAVPADFGWSVPVNNVDIVANGAYGPALADGGAYSLDLVGYGSTGEIEQSIDTVAGKTYTLSLEYAANHGVANPTAAVLVNGQTLGSLTGGATWTQFSATFTGTGAPMTVAFDETYGANNGGVFLDNISVAAVPEPATWAMLILGLGLTGVMLRRRNGLAVA
jgi:hypothetical protein